MTTYFIARHPGAKVWAEQEGFHIDVLAEHFDTAVVRPGDRVLGILPVNLAAEVCARGGRYFHLSMEVPQESRGRDLSAEDMRRFGAALKEFHIEAAGRKAI